MQLPLIWLFYSIQEQELETKSNQNNEVIKKKKCAILRKWGVLFLKYASFFTFLFLIVVIFHNPTVTGAIGMMSGLLELSLPLPQFYNNWVMKSTRSLSFMMIFFWGFGDLIKVAFLFAAQ